ncbi:MAG TPA: sigma-70 family RNA polymerase sigma factor [Candidatus Acidoferrales bacterium]|nr:sigma-70 family RNA polymerase sigma factor [Candidatus Acidoferrales bacterium]
MNGTQQPVSNTVQNPPRVPQSRDAQEALIARAQAGNHDALEALFSNLSPALYQTALRLVGTPEEAEDVLQEGMLSAYRNLRRFEGRSQFSTWLTRIVINAALMRLRSRRSRPAVSLDERLADDDEMTFADQFPDTAPNPEQVASRRELEDLLRHNLQTLSPVLRSAFILREMEGFSTEEAAEELGISQGTLKARLHRAKRQLARLVGRALHPGGSRERREPRIRLQAIPSACASD